MKKLEDKVQKAFEEAGRHVVLSADERTLMRERLVLYTEHMPMRTNVQPEFAEKQQTGFSRVFAFFSNEHLVGAALIAVLVVTGTFGVSRAAEDALPGDLLYPVKVDVNEKMHAAFIGTEQELLAWERERAERRLVEASQLASEGRLDGALKDEVLRRFAEHSDVLVAHVQAMEPENPILALEQSNEFEATLDNHEAMLARIIVEREDDSATDARDFVEQVRVVAKRAGDAAAAVEERLAVATVDNAEGVLSLASTSLTEQETEGSNKGDVDEPTSSANVREQAAYSAKARAEKERAEAEAELSRLSGNVALEAQAKTQLELGSTHMTTGAAALERGDITAAYREYKQAASLYQKVSQLLSMANLFNIKVYVSDEYAFTDPSPMLGSESLSTQQARVQEKLTGLRSKLLASSLQENTLEETRELLKEALAYLMRGDIARSLGDEESAQRLYNTADRFGDRVRAKLGTVQEDAPVNSGGTSGTPGQTGKPVMPPVPPELPALDTVTVYHQYKDGTHTYSGVYYTPTPCFDVTTSVDIAKSLPEQITLKLVAKDEGGACAMILDRKAWSVEVQADAAAQFVGVRVNDTESKYKLVEGPNTEIFEDVPNVPVTRPQGNDDQSTDEKGFVERTFDATSAFLRTR